MKQLPKELTPELLGLVLGEKVYYKDLAMVKVHIGNNELFYSKKDYKWTGHSINLDTLTRLCKEWCYNCKDDSVSIVIYHDHLGKYNAQVDFTIATELGEQWFSGDTELEAVIEATHWVDKKKGLINV